MVLHLILSTVFFSSSALCLNLSSCYLILYLNLVGGATKTFPTVILLKSQIDRHRGSSDANAGIAALPVPSGQSGNGHWNCKTAFCISLKEKDVSMRRQ